MHKSTMDTDSDILLLVSEPSQAQDTATLQTEAPTERRTISRTKRSKVACSHCRRRKVRCDVHPHGSPCTNCRLDGISDCAPCRKKTRRWELPQQSRPLKPPPVQPRPQSTKSEASESSTRPSSGAVLCEKVTVGGEHNEAAQNPSRASSSPILDHGSPIESRDTRPGISEPLSQQMVQQTTTSPPRPLFPQSWSAPCFLTCDLSNISIEDVAYLRSKGCFSFPEKDILDELLQSYFDYIAPHMPFIDETSFWDMYHAYYYCSSEEKTSLAGQSSMSLLLFQAMLFAATTCAPMSLLKRFGYTSRRIARRDAFFRVRALYSLDIERNSLALVQAFLLMSYWRGEPGEDKDAWHWVGLAVSLAYHLGLHRKPLGVLTQRQETVRRRCWWSCVVRDRLVALAQHRRPRIKLAESDVAMLTMADYNMSLRSGMSGLSPAEELGKRTALSMFNVQLIRLVLCMEADSDSPATQPCLAPLTASNTWTRTKQSPRNDARTVGHPGLDDWRTNLPEILQRSACPDADESVLPCILVLRNALQIYYHKIILSMVSPRLLLSRELDGRPSREVDLARRSSTALVELHNDLVDRDSIHCLPSMDQDSKPLATFDAKPYTIEAQFVGSDMWSSLMAEVGVCLPGSSRPFGIDVECPVDDDHGALSKAFDPFGDGSMFDDHGTVSTGGDKDSAMLPGLASSTADGSTQSPSTLVSFDSFLPLDGMKHDEGMMDDNVASELLKQVSDSYDGDTMLFT